MLSLSIKTILVSWLLVSATGQATPRLPHGFKLVKEDIGHGAYSEVHLVKNKTTKKLYAMKVAKDPNNPRHIMNYRKQLALHYGWSLIGLTTTTMLYDPQDGRYLLHEFVDGPTLTQAYQEEGFTFSPKDPRTVALHQWLSTLIANRVYSPDLNADNIIYDGHSWQIIDSTGFHLKSTYQSTFDAYRKKFTFGRKWSGRVSDSAVQKFLKVFEKKYLNNITTDEPVSTSFRDYVRWERKAKKDNYLKVSKKLPKSYFFETCQDILL